MDAYTSSTNTGSEQSPQTPASSSSVTPLIGRNKFTPEMIRTPPLFTKEQREENRRRKDQLEVEIAVLKKRQMMLEAESKKIRENKVSVPELIEMKAEVKLRMANSNGNTLSSLIDEYLEVQQGTRELEAACEMLTEMIKSETEEREKMMEMSDEISQLFDFSQFKVTLPQLPAMLPPEVGTEQVISQAQTKVSNIRLEQMKYDQVRPDSTAVTDAATAISRRAESEYQLRSHGATLLRYQIQNLQKQMAESESELRKMEKSADDERARLTEYERKKNDTENSVSSSASANANQFKDMLLSMEDEIAKLKSQVNESAQRFDRIQREIDNIGEPDGYVEEEESSEYVTGDIIDSQQFDELVRKRQSLAMEVQQLKHQYKSMKRSIAHDRARKKDEVGYLYSRIIHNKQVMMQDQMQIKDRYQSPLDKSLAALVKKIDSSITELKSGLAI